MSTPDRPNGSSMPAWQPAPPPAIPQAVEPWEEIPPEVGMPQARTVTAKVVWRAARRHWWQILILWIITSAGLMYLAYNKIRTSYEATAWLIVKASAPRIFEQHATAADFSRYQKTQVDLVTSPDVLSDTLATHPELLQLPLLKDVPKSDVEAEIRRVMRVQIRPDTSLIMVSLDSEYPNEAEAIVNAVVECYLKAANHWANQETTEQVKQLQDEEQKLQKEIEQKKTILAKQVENIGNISPNALEENAHVSMERFKNFVAKLDQHWMDRVKLEGDLESARLRQGRSIPKAALQAGRDQQVSSLFYAHPEVKTLVESRSRAQATYDSTKRLARKGSDPSLRQAQKRVEELNAQINKLWAQLEPQLQQELARDPLDENEKTVQELEALVTAAKNTESSLQSQLKAMEVENKETGSGALQVQFARVELDDANKKLASIQNHISQLEYESKGPARVARANDRTRVDPSASKRTKVMAAAPVLMLGLLLGLFVLVEVRSGRVADPDELPARVRLEVIGVVPPLPSLRPPKALWGSRDELRARRQLEEFVQSLDHLRVALYSGRKGAARRCVVITSACSSEGKTTLAAHLAGRCANAGLSTLLIDADLRNPSLSRLLKVPDGPGLSDVLHGDMTAEAAMMVIQAGGGFHLLPAGTSGYDPSRLLQGEQLGQLISQLRSAFDIVIMDTPPVLLVADALTVGRWADGALLAVRYDTSRFPLVERAQRRLAAVGVPVIGAVVNGVRTMDSSYGYYSYAYQADRPTNPAVPATTINVPAERADG